jgi:hypothetical protein
MPPPLKITVCTWEPTHTLDRIRAQQTALRDGTIAKLVKEHGKGTDSLRSAMMNAGLVSVATSLDRSDHCTVCGALVDTVFGPEGVTDKLMAMTDIAQDFNRAIERTRRLR